MEFNKVTHLNNLQKLLRFCEKIGKMERLLEEHDHNGEYMFIGIAVLMIVFIAVGVFLESRHVSILAKEVSMDQEFELSWPSSHSS